MEGSEMGIGRWLAAASESVRRIRQLAMSTSRKWRRRRTRLGKSSAEAEAQQQGPEQSSELPKPPPNDEENETTDDDPWAASEPYVDPDAVAESEPSDMAGPPSDEDVKPTQEDILETNPTAVQMADESLTDQFNNDEQDLLPNEEWLAGDEKIDNSAVNESDASEMLTMPEGLYDKLMQPDNEEDEELLVAASDEEEHDDVCEEDLMTESVTDLTSSDDSSAQLKFSPGKFHEDDERNTEATEEQEDQNIKEEAVVNMEPTGESNAGDAADAGDSDPETEGLFAKDEEHVIAGEASSVVPPVHPAMPEGLLDSADPSENETASPVNSNSSLDGASEEVLPDHMRHQRFLTGAAMKDKTDSEEGKNEIATSSRMNRLKPKSANSLTGAPLPKIDGHVEDSVLAPETEVLLVAIHAPERNTFRTYFRRHDIPCRAAISAENAVSVVLGMKPSAILVSGSCMNPEEIITLVDDLNDMVEAPVLALLTEPQMNLLSNDPLSAHVLQYPASLRHIRAELNRILLEEGNAKPRCSLRSALLPE